MALVSVRLLIGSDLHACVARAGSGSNFPIEVVLDHDDLLAAIGVGLEHTLNRSVGSLALASSNVPPDLQTIDSLARLIRRKEKVTYALRIISSK